MQQTTEESEFELYFSNTVLLPKTGTLIVNLFPIILPPNTLGINGFTVSTGQSYTNEFTKL